MYDVALETTTGIHRLQGPVLPGCDLRHDLLHELHHELRGNLRIVQLLRLLGNIPLAHVAGVEGQDILLHVIRVPAVLPNNFRLEAAVLVPRPRDFHPSQLGIDSLFRVAVAVVGRSLSSRRLLTPLPAQFLVQLYLNRSLDNVSEHLPHGFYDLCGAVFMLSSIPSRIGSCLHF